MTAGRYSQPYMEAVDFTVVVYSGTPRAFRTTLIGYLYEISQHYSTVLLSEELDEATQELLRDRSLFPRLKEVIPVRQFGGDQKSRLKQSRYLCRTARNAIGKCKPAVVVAPSDNDSLFELFLMRFARRNGSFNISISCTLTYPNVRDIRRYVDLINIHERMPTWLPLWTRRMLIVARKYAGHAFVYWILPVFCGQAPFWGMTSYILHRGHSGMRDANLQVVMHPKDVSTYVSRGVPAEKLVLLPHPILRRAGKCIKGQVAESIHASGKKVLFLLPENNISFRSSDGQLILPDEVHRMRCDILEMASAVLPDRTFLIKPHPLTKDTLLLETFCKKHCPQAVFVSKNSQVEELIPSVDAVVELPRSGSTALYTAVLWAPDIPKIAINISDEFYADYYRDFPGVIYVSSLGALKEALLALSDQNLSAGVRKSSTEQESGDICSEILSKIDHSGSKNFNLGAVD